MESVQWIRHEVWISSILGSIHQEPDQERRIQKRRSQVAEIHQRWERQRSDDLVRGCYLERYLSTDFWKERYRAHDRRSVTAVGKVLALRDRRETERAESITTRSSWAEGKIKEIKRWSLSPAIPGRKRFAWISWSWFSKSSTSQVRMGSKKSGSNVPDSWWATRLHTQGWAMGEIKQRAWYVRSNDSQEDSQRCCHVIHRAQRCRYQYWESSRWWSGRCALHGWRLSGLHWRT